MKRALMVILACLVFASILAFTKNAQAIENNSTFYVWNDIGNGSFIYDINTDAFYYFGTTTRNTISENKLRVGKITSAGVTTNYYGPTGYYLSINVAVGDSGNVLWGTNYYYQNTPGYFYIRRVVLTSNTWTRWYCNDIGFSPGAYTPVSIAADNSFHCWILGDTGSSQLIKYYNGSSWITVSNPSGVTPKKLIFSAKHNKVYLGCATLSDNAVYYWNGSGWTALPGKGVNGFDNMFLDYNGDLVVQSGSNYKKYDGSSWSNADPRTVQFDLDADGTKYRTRRQGTFYWLQRYNGTTWVDVFRVNNEYGLGYYLYCDNVLFLKDKSKLILHGPGWYIDDFMSRDYGIIMLPTSSTEYTLSVSAVSKPADGNVYFDPKIGSYEEVQTPLEWSTDNNTWNSVAAPIGGNVCIDEAYASGKTNLYIRYRLLKQGDPYSNTLTLPLLPSAPNVTVNSGVQQWSNSRGRDWVTLSWSAVTNAHGYKLWIFDGNQYQVKDLGNVTSWDSRSNKIFPFPIELPENNSVSSNLFHFDGSGTDFEDTMLRLYRTTVGTSYDSDPKVYIRITAYNQWMETDINATSSFKTIILPTATDVSQPTGTVSAVSQEGLEKTYNRDINVTVNIADSGSGIYTVELSNDGVTYTVKYTATKNSTGATGVTSYTNTFTWTLPLGAGTKVVYVRVTDAVGNVKILSDTIALAEDMLPPSVTLTINSGADSTTSPTVTLTITASDNSSSSSQMQMRFSNNATLWSAWEAFNQTKSWDITNSSYGGNTSAGIKKVYIQVCDQAQNVSLAYDEIGYNPSPPTGTVTVQGGTSGTWNGQTALFSVSDSPTLTLSFTGASQIRFDLGAGVWTDWETYASSKTVNLIKSSGACTLKIQVKDSYGVASPIYSYLIVIDSQAPTISTFRGANRATATTGTSITMELVATDNLPGTLQYRYKINSGSFTSWANLSGSSITVSGLSSGANNITLEVKDLAGNTASASALVFKAA